MSTAPARSAASPASSCARAWAPVLTSPGAGPGATARTPGPAARPSSRRRSAPKASCWRSALWTSPAAANARMRIACACSLNGSIATRRAAWSAAASGAEAARLARAASASTASEAACRWRRSFVSHTSNDGLDGKSMPSRRSRPRPGARAASAQSPERTAWTSTNVPGGRASATGDPRSTPGSPSRRRSSLRFQRSAPSGSSASANRSAARRSRGTGRRCVSRCARSAQALRPRGGGASAPSRETDGGPSRWMPRSPTTRR